MTDEIDLPIDHHHDHFYLGLTESDDPLEGDYPSVQCKLWSRGTFGVDIELSAEDACSLGAAFTKLGELALEKRPA